MCQIEGKEKGKKTKIKRKGYRIPDNKLVVRGNFENKNKVHVIGH